MNNSRNSSDEKKNTSPNKPMPEDVLNAAQDPNSIKDPLQEELKKSAEMERRNKEKDSSANQDNAKDQ